MSKTLEQPKKHAIFYLKPIKDSNNVIIKCAGIIEANEKILDEPLECGEGGDKFTYRINDDIIVKMYRCNIPDWFLMTTRTLPVICASIIYQNPIMSCNLFNILIEYNITSKIESEKELINNTLDGNFQMRIDAKNNPLTINLDKYEKTQEMVKLIINLIKTKTTKNIIDKTIEEKRHERIQRLGGLNDIDIPIVTHKDINLINNYNKNGKLELKNSI